jgi:phage protein U
MAAKRTKKGRPMSDDDCGCNSEYAALADVEDEVATDVAPDPRGGSVRRFRDQLIAPYGKPTGDKRRFRDGSLTSRPLPYGMKWQREDNQGHSTSITVGRIDAVSFKEDGPEGPGVYASGIFFQPDPDKMPRWAEDCEEAFNLTKETVIGPSVDLDAMDFHEYTGPEEGEEEYAAAARPEIEVTRGRISSVTLVQIPAFAEARPFAIEEQDAGEYATELEAYGNTITASGVFEHDEAMPVAAEATWDLEHWILEGSGHDGAALYSGNEGDLFPVADVVDGQLALIPGAVADAISMLSYHPERIGLAEGVKDVLRERLTDLAIMCDLPLPPWTGVGPDALVAAGTIADWVPNREFFEDPQLDGPTPIRVKDGRVYGHLATWGACHIGFKHCVKPPRSRTNYAHFHVGEIETTDGPLAVGKLTLGGGHADTQLGFQAAAEHYDDAGTAVAAVRAGEDRHGIWISGVALPGAEGQFATLPLYPLSGDWRRIGGSMEMIAALAVNTPGFSIPRVSQDRGRELALVAAGVLLPEHEAEEGLTAFRDVSTKTRDRLAAKRQANPDGSFPIETVGDLQNAIQAYGRAKDKPKTRALIMRMAKKLGREDLIPESWRGTHAEDYAAQDVVRAFRQEAENARLGRILDEELDDLGELHLRQAALAASTAF